MADLHGRNQWSDRVGVSDLCRFFCVISQNKFIQKVANSGYLCIFAKNFEIMRQTKCIIVHLTGKRKTLAFGSIAAIFHHLTPEQVGCGYDYLRRAGLSGGGTVVTKRAIIQQTTLLTAPRGAGDGADD